MTASAGVPNPYRPRPRAQTGPEIQTVLEALLQHLDVVLDGFSAFAHQTLWEPAHDDAPLTVDRREATDNQIGPGGPWTDELFVYAHSAAVLHTSLAAQLLEGLHALIASREVMFPLAPIVRSLEENCGLVCWLIYPGERLTWPRPNDAGGLLLQGWGTRRRGARAHLARVEDLTHRKTTAKLLDYPNLPKIGHRLRTARRDKLHAHFYPSEIDDADGKLILRGESFPRLGELASWIERLQGIDWNSAGVYAVLSGATHPSFSHLAEFVRVDHEGRPGRWQLDDASYPYRVTRAAILSFTVTWQLLTAYLAHPQDEPNKLAQAFDQDRRFHGL